MPSCLLVAAAAVGSLVGLGWMAGTQIRYLAADLERPDYAANFNHKFEPVMHLAERVERLRELLEQRLDALLLVPNRDDDGDHAD